MSYFWGTGSDWKNLPGTAQFLSTQTDTMFAFIYKIVYKLSLGMYYAQNIVGNE
jgi:hypothetical protein